MVKTRLALREALLLHMSVLQALQSETVKMAALVYSHVPHPQTSKVPINV